MSSSEPSTFDLVDSPWLLARRTDGVVEELSLLDVVRRAGELTSLVGEVPTQTFALTRLLLAVLHRAVKGPRDDDHWQQLWAAPSLPVEQVARYLDEHRARFDLMHPSTPFFQVARLCTSKGEVSELTKLIADVPNGNPFFTTRIGVGNATISLAEGARWLVHCQAFDPSGIKSGAVGDARVKGGKGYPIGVAWSGQLGGVFPEGVTLRETLLLNLISSELPQLARWRDTDAPAWEREPVGAGEEQVDGRAPTGPTDLYTWQSRRIRLAHHRGRITGVLVCNGERITPQNKHIVEPHSGWRRSNAQEKKLGEALVYMPRAHAPERSVWRGLQSILPAAGSVRQAADASLFLAPVVLEWVAHLRTQGLLGRDFPVRVHAVGMIYGSNNSITDEIIDDVLPIRALLLERDADALSGIALACADACDHSARAIGSLAANLAEASGGEYEGPRNRAMELAFAELDGPFRHWIGALDSHTDPTDAQASWHRLAYRVISRLGWSLLAEASPSAWVGRAVKGNLVTTAHADQWFRRDLRKALPLAQIDAPDASLAQDGPHQPTGVTP